MKDEGAVGIFRHGMCDDCRYTPAGLSLLQSYAISEMDEARTASVLPARKPAETRLYGSNCRGCFCRTEVTQVARRLKFLSERRKRSDEVVDKA